MKTLLRSTFVVTQTDKRDKDLLLRNCMDLIDSGLVFDIAQDVPIWTFVREFVSAHNHVPEFHTIRSHFSHSSEDEVVGRLDALQNLPCVTGGDFVVRLTDLAEERRHRIAAEVLKQASHILQTGMEVKNGHEKKIMKGPSDAIHYVVEKGHDIVAPVIGSKVSGELTRDGEDFYREYQKVKMDPQASVGQHCGIEQIDMVMNGAKDGELWIHAAYSGHTKSTFMANWAYNQAVWYRHSSLIIELEMKYAQVRRIIYTLHTSHEKFRQIRIELGLQTDPNITVGLPYTAIRDGLLAEYHPNAEKFLFEYVVPDLNGEKVVEGIDPNTGEPWDDPKNYGRIHLELMDSAASDITVVDIKQRAEVIHSKSPFKTLFLDHAGLLSPKRWVPSQAERLNEVLRDCKRLALGFNRGQGMAVVALFQISRDGFKAALKTKEKTGVARYEIIHLSYSNEAERSADVVTAAWVDDELSKLNRVQFQCLKARDNGKFDPFYVRVEWATKRMLTCDDIIMTTSDKSSVGDSIDKKSRERSIEILSL